MSAIELFDRRLLRQRRDRAAESIHDFDFLFRETADSLMDRIGVIKKSFPLVLDLGGAHGLLAERLRERKGTERVISMDTSFEMARKTKSPVVADEEFLPFQSNSLDAVISNLALQWVNDLPGSLIQIRNALKPDGAFLCALLGGETLKELRACLMEAELDITGGASPRVSPFVDPYDMSALMQRAGFALPTVDIDTVTAEYAHPLKLMHDLRGMGAANALLNRLRQPTRRKVMMEALRLYQEKFSGKDERVQATFQIIYAIGWKPS